MTREQARILFVDDERFHTQRYADALRDAGFSVHVVHTTDGALTLARMHRYDVVILDVMMPPGRAFRPRETAAGHKTGLALGRELRNILPESRLIALTHSDDAEVEAWFTSDEQVAYLLKSNVLPAQLPHAVRRLIRDPDHPPRVFIVHGRDMLMLEALKDFIQRDLEWGLPVVLGEQPSGGGTVIEKLKHYAATADIVFVLATPDDIGALATEDSPLKPRNCRGTARSSIFLGGPQRWRSSAGGRHTGGR